MNSYFLHSLSVSSLVHSDEGDKRNKEEIKRTSESLLRLKNKSLRCFEILLRTFTQFYKILKFPKSFIIGLPMTFFCNSVKREEVTSRVLNIEPWHRKVVFLYLMHYFPRPISQTRLGWPAWEHLLWIESAFQIKKSRNSAEMLSIFL